MQNNRDKKSIAVRISLRLSPALHKQLQEQAQNEHRSLHGQIVWLLENTLAEREAVRESSNRARHAAG
jgi:hypothetical protein